MNALQIVLFQHKKAKSNVGESQVYNLRTTHSPVLKGQVLL